MTFGSTPFVAGAEASKIRTRPGAGLTGKCLLLEYGVCSRGWEA